MSCWFQKMHQVKAEPNLEILNNEVRASHGATLKTIDEQQLLYLQSRGLSKNKAEKLIIDGFFKGVDNRIKSDLVRNYFEK